MTRPLNNDLDTLNFFDISFCRVEYKSHNCHQTEEKVNLIGIARTIAARRGNLNMSTLTHINRIRHQSCATVRGPAPFEGCVHTRVVRNWRLTYSTRSGHLSRSGSRCKGTTCSWCSSCTSHWEEIRALRCRIVPIVIHQNLLLSVAASVTLVAATRRTHAITVITHFRIQACQGVGLPTDSIEFTVDTACCATGLTTHHIDLAGVCRANKLRCGCGCIQACEAVGLPTDCAE